jgi:hypothetical protein
MFSLNVREVTQDPVVNQFMEPGTEVNLDQIVVSVVNPPKSKVNVDDQKSCCDSIKNKCANVRGFCDEEYGCNKRTDCCGKDISCCCFLMINIVVDVVIFGIILFFVLRDLRP